MYTQTSWISRVFALFPGSKVCCGTRQRVLGCQAQSPQTCHENIITSKQWRYCIMASVSYAHRKINYTPEKKWKNYDICDYIIFVSCLRHVWYYIGWFVDGWGRLLGSWPLSRGNISGIWKWQPPSATINLGEGEGGKTHRVCEKHFSYFYFTVLIDTTFR